MPTMNFAAVSRGRRLRRILGFETIFCLNPMKMITPEKIIPCKLASINQSKFKSKFKSIPKVLIIMPLKILKPPKNKYFNL
jgi:hypothetical protein